MLNESSPKPPSSPADFLPRFPVRSRSRALMQRPSRLFAADPPERPSRRTADHGPRIVEESSIKSGTDDSILEIAKRDDRIALRSASCRAMMKRCRRTVLDTRGWTS